MNIGLVYSCLAILTASYHDLELIVVGLAWIVLRPLLTNLLVPALLLILDEISELVKTDLALIFHFADLVLRDLLKYDDSLASWNPDVLHS